MGLKGRESVSYTHLRAHETDSYLVCRLLLEKKQAEDAGSAGDEYQPSMTAAGVF